VLLGVAWGAPRGRLGWLRVHSGMPPDGFGAKMRVSNHNVSLPADPPWGALPAAPGNQGAPGGTLSSKGRPEGRGGLEIPARSPRDVLRVTPQVTPIDLEPQ